MQKNPIVGVVMGSDSDLPVVKKALDVFEYFDIPYEVHILSAHRTPEETASYAQSLVKRNVQVIIAAAGGAAHLAGVIAAHILLPVIGIPIQTPALNGVDSLYSIVQMPPGIPVATVGINSAKNAGLLAVQIMAIHDKEMQKKFIEYRKTQREDVLNKSKKLQKIGYKEYLKVMEKK